MPKQLVTLLSVITLFSFTNSITMAQVGGGGGGNGNSPPQFTITTVSWSVDGVNSFTTFGPGQLTVPNAAVTSTITISGTYSPANATVSLTFIWVGVAGNAGAYYTPTCANGGWTATVPANTLPTNSNINVYSNYEYSNGSYMYDTAYVNSTQVDVTLQTFTIGTPP